MDELKKLPNISLPDTNYGRNFDSLYWVQRTLDELRTRLPEWQAIEQHNQQVLDERIAKAKEMLKQLKEWGAPSSIQNPRGKKQIPETYTDTILSGIKWQVYRDTLPTKGIKNLHAEIKDLEKKLEALQKAEVAREKLAEKEKIEAQQTAKERAKRFALYTFAQRYDVYDEELLQYDYVDLCYYLAERLTAKYVLLDLSYAMKRARHSFAYYGDVDEPLKRLKTSTESIPDKQAIIADIHDTLYDGYDRDGRNYRDTTYNYNVIDRIAGSVYNITNEDLILWDTLCWASFSSED